jgi:hypothetical protein
MRILLFAAFFVCFISCGKGGVDPSLLGIDDPMGQGAFSPGERNFARLFEKHREGTPERQPWAGFWWPYSSNGISRAVADGSSPAGKYDAARGGTTRAESWEVVNHGSEVPNIQGWWGHCNGWCVAAALFPEPREAVVVNGIRFGVADIKGLLTEASMASSADYFGERLDPWDRDYARKYADTVPNQFFLVLTHYMGRNRRTVLIDRHTGSEVWNQPLAGYRFQTPTPSDYLGPAPGAPAVHRLRLTVTLWWMDDNVPPGILSPPFEFQTNSAITARTLRMELWLDGPVVFDAAGKVVRSGDVVVAREGGLVAGGQWLGPNTTQGHPDYMWVPYSVIEPDPADDDPYSNIHVDIGWIRRHILAAQDDPSVRPLPVGPAPPIHTPEPPPAPGPSPSPPPSPPAPST